VIAHPNGYVGRVIGRKARAAKARLTSLFLIRLTARARAASAAATLIGCEWKRKLHMNYRTIIRSRASILPEMHAALATSNQSRQTTVFHEN